MDFGVWEKKVPEKIKNDALWTVKSYKLGLFLTDLAWSDCTKLMSVGTEIIKLLLTTVPQQSGYSVRENSEEYTAPQSNINDVPLP